MSKVKKSGLSVIRDTPAPGSLSIEDARKLLTICAELLALCSRVSGRVDPTVGAMVAYARDELREALSDPN